MIKFLLFPIFSFFSITCFAQGAEWAHVIGGSGNDNAKSSCADSNDNLYHLATFENTIDTDTGAEENIIVAESIDSYISKINSQGQHQWTAQLVGDGDIHAATIKEHAGFLYITGVFKGSVDFDPGAAEHSIASPSNSGFDMFLLKLDIDGIFQWVKTWGTDDALSAKGLAIDAEGSIYIGGGFVGSMDVDPGPGEVIYSNSFGKGMLIKLDSNGDYIWSHFIGDSNTSGFTYDNVRGCEIDSEGKLIILGSLKGSFDFDLGPGENIHTSEETVSFICKYDSDANLIWSRFIENYGDALSITIDNNDNVITGGRFGGDVDFNTDDDGELILSNSGEYWDIFIQKINSSGSFEWAVSFGGNFFPAEHCWALKCDMNNGIYATGSICGNGDLDPGPGEALFNLDGFSDLYVSKFDQDGNYEWSYTAGGTLLFDSDVKGVGLHIDQLGKVYVLGEFRGNVDFGPLNPGLIDSEGSWDIFQLKIDESITDLQELEDFDEITIYPNPTSSEIFLNSAVDIQTMDIIDLTGRLVSSVNLNGTRSISVAHLPEGHYILKMRSGNDQFISRLVVRR